MTRHIIIVKPDTPQFQAVLDVAEQLDQARYVTRDYAHADASFVLGAWLDHACVGFLRLLIQIIGRSEGRPPIMRANQALREGFVEAFGVLPQVRRHGIGQALQEYAIMQATQSECYQVRSRSPVTSVENYALKLKMGYAIQPSNENDSYYFIKALM